MPLPDDIIRRWLDEAAADAGPRLDRASAGDPCVGDPCVGTQQDGSQKDGNEQDGEQQAESELEFQRLRARLQLVQGLLSTLDLKTAPKELDALVELDQVSKENEPVLEPGFAEWMEDLESDPILGSSKFAESHKAPEFLDRIVEQRLADMECFDGGKNCGENSRGKTQQGVLARGLRTEVRTKVQRWMAGAGVAALLLVAPLVLSEMLASGQGPESTSLRLVNYDSLEGLQRAFPNQSQVANGVGILGAFGVTGKDSGGSR